MIESLVAIRAQPSLPMALEDAPASKGATFGVKRWSVRGYHYVRRSGHPKLQISSVLELRSFEPLRFNHLILQWVDIHESLPPKALAPASFCS